jgi:hypothetical protein
MHRGKASYIAAVQAIALADQIGSVVVIQWDGETVKASPGDSLEGVLKAFDSIPGVRVDPTDIKLNQGGGPTWIGTPDPGYQGETIQTVPFE